MVAGRWKCNYFGGLIFVPMRSANLFSQKKFMKTSRIHAEIRGKLAGLPTFSRDGKRGRVLLLG